jgi:hypothetical protein
LYFVISDTIDIPDIVGAPVDQRIEVGRNLKTEPAKLQGLSERSPAIIHGRCPAIFGVLNIRRMRYRSNRANAVRPGIHRFPQLWLVEALNTIARVRAEQGDTAAFPLMQHQAMCVGQRRVELRMQKAQLGTR